MYILYTDSVLNKDVEAQNSIGISLCSSDKWEWNCASFSTTPFPFLFGWGSEEGLLSTPGSDEDGHCVGPGQRLQHPHTAVPGQGRAQEMGQAPVGGAHPAVLSAGTAALLFPCSELGQHLWISWGCGKSSPESSPWVSTCPGPLSLGTITGLF